MNAKAAKAIRRKAKENVVPGKKELKKEGKRLKNIYKKEVKGQI